MTKVDIISGFLGAGKTTFIKELIAKVYKGEKIVLIENEFGEIGIDSRFMQNSGIEVTEMNSGCICCTLVGDFAKALKQVVDEFQPDRVIIEHYGCGRKKGKGAYQDLCLIFQQPDRVLYVNLSQPQPDDNGRKAEGVRFPAAELQPGGDDYHDIVG